MSGRSVILTTLFLDKPPGSSLPVFSAHSLARNVQLALLESAEEGNSFSMNECTGGEGRSRDRLYTKRTCNQLSYHARLVLIVSFCVKQSTVMILNF